MALNYRGLIAPVFTPFKDDMTINLNIIDDYAVFLDNSGIKGILVNGTTGEGPSLSVNERKLITEKWKDAVIETKQHLMIQVGGAPLPDVIELAKHAEKLKVDSLLCLPELYFKPKDTSELINYLKLISEAAPNTPLLYYHIPSFSNVNINMGNFMNDIIGKVPTFCGIKFTSTCLDEGLLALKANNENYAVFLGADTVLLGAIALGFDSAIATTLNIFPDLSINIINLMKIRDLVKAKEQQEKLNDAIKVITKNGTWVATMKHAMNLMTPIKVGGVRNPLFNLNEAQVKEINDLLHNLSFKSKK